MRDWHLTQSDPLALRLAADARQAPTDYPNDHIWELGLAGGDPPALGARTTYGLRAQDMRLFFGFAEGDQHVTDPAEFAAPPEVRAFYVNYIRVTCEPFAGLEVSADFWVPDSHTLAGQFTFTNHSAAPRLVSLLLSALLKPLANPRVMATDQVDIFGRAGLLEGQTGNLDVLVLLEGPAPARAAPYPTIGRPLYLEPGETLPVRWVQAASLMPTVPPPAPARGEPPPVNHREAGIERIRQLLLQEEWEGEFARIELLNAGLLDIETGERDWDAALAFAQTVALRGYVGPTDQLPHPSFVFSRHADRGYSVKGDGSDYTWLWNGQVATEAYVNLPQIVAAAPELAKGILRNWLAVQAEDGFIDWKPGLAGQRERTLCIPLLATLAWRLYEHSEDAAFVAEVYPGLRRFLEAWFTATTATRMACPNGPTPSNRPLTTTRRSCAGSPGGRGRISPPPRRPTWRAISIASAGRWSAWRRWPGCRPSRRWPSAPSAWRSAWTACGAARWPAINMWTATRHAGPAGEVLASGRGELAVDIVRRFTVPARLLVKVVGPREARPQMTVSFSGRGRRGRHRVENLRQSRMQWFFGIGTAGSDKLYSQLDRVEVRGLTDEFEVTVSTVDYTRQDQTLLLPLWAGLPDRARAEALVRRTLLDPERYWRANGLPNCSAAEPAYQPDNRGGSGGVWMMWNTMLGEGLVDYGYRAEAAELIARLMRGMLYTLKEEKSFREAYNPDQLEGLGDRDYLWGVAPVALFMQTLGVRIVSPRKVYLSGRNPFPWPVTVRHKGLTVVRGHETTTVTFPSGRSATASGEGEQVITDGAGFMVGRAALAARYIGTANKCSRCAPRWGCILGPAPRRSAAEKRPRPAIGIDNSHETHARRRGIIFCPPLRLSRYGGRRRCILKFWRGSARRQGHWIALATVPSCADHGPDFPTTYQPRSSIPRTDDRRPSGSDPRTGRSYSGKVTKPRIEDRPTNYLTLQF